MPRPARDTNPRKSRPPLVPPTTNSQSQNPPASIPFPTTLIQAAAHSALTSAPYSDLEKSVMQNHTTTTQSQRFYSIALLNLLTHLEFSPGPGPPHPSEAPKKLAP